MSRVVPAGALLIFLLALATAGGAAGSSPQARAAGSCHLSSYEQRHLGASYVTSLTVSNTSCKTGKAVVRSYHRNGGHVSGWSCHRRILDKSPAQYDARATCTRGSKRVVHTYTKNT